MPSVFRLVGGARTPEVFTATALLLVVGTAFLAKAAGLSMSLGAFLAGVLLSSSEYRHELQADIAPFEGLLLGFFFMSVGMSAQLGLAVARPGADPARGARPAGEQDGRRVRAWPGSAAGMPRTALRFALALPQGSEFSFVLFGAAVAAGALPRADADRATLVIALSMAATPILFAAAERFVIPRLMAPKADEEYDVIEDAAAPVIICGFGRMGQIIGRVLRMQGIGFTALEQDAAQVEVVRRFGSKVYFGNPERPELLRAAGAETAKLLVVALDDMEETLRVVEIARRLFPDLKILARARNRRHAHLLMDRGIADPVRETFYSSLVLTERVLETIGIPAEEAQRAVDFFRFHDEQWLRDSHAFYDDEKQLIQSGAQVATELAGLFESDKPDPLPKRRTSFQP